MNNFKRRALIFVTFFGSCLAISLLSAALGTKHWITAKCRRTTEFSDKSYGQVNFGLFNYEANLNFGIGNRTYMENMLGRVTTRMPSKHETFFQAMIFLSQWSFYFIVERTINEFALSRSVFFGNEAHETKSVLLLHLISR